jgi:hypothetical protein
MLSHSCDIRDGVLVFEAVSTPVVVFLRSFNSFRVAGISSLILGLLRQQTRFLPAS